MPMRRRLGSLLLGLILCQPWVVAQADEWMALTLYPGGSVYQASHLELLVGATDSLWEVRDARGQPVLGVVDSLATTNAIVTQGEDVRFRRLIELQELDGPGLARLAQAVEDHPLLGRRLVTEDGEGTHFWFRLTESVAATSTAEERSEVLVRLARRLGQSFGATCRRRGGEDLAGSLADYSFSRWVYSSSGERDIVKVLQQLSGHTEALGEVSLMSYSVADLLGYLKGVLDGRNSLPRSENEVAQLYMIAESLRSRDLHDLARPDFQRVELVALGHENPLKAPELDGYALSADSSWKASEGRYLVVDCR